MISSRWPSHSTSLQFTFALSSSQIFRIRDAAPHQYAATKPPSQACQDIWQCLSMQLAFTSLWTQVCREYVFALPSQAAPSHCALPEPTFELPSSKMPTQYSPHQCTCALPLSQAPTHWASLHHTFALAPPQAPLRCASLQLTFALPPSPVCQDIRYCTSLQLTLALPSSKATSSCTSPHTLSPHCFRHMHA